MNKLYHWLFEEGVNSSQRSNRSTHTYVIGQPGTGKSRAMESWIRQDIALGHGVGVIDPHGDLFTSLIFHLAAHPELWSRVVILDPCHPKWTFPFNPLETAVGTSPERLSLFMTDIIVKIWGVDPASAPRMVWLLTNSFLALAKLGLSLHDLPRFLLENEYRDRLLAGVEHEGVRLYFQNEYPRGQSAAHQWAAPVLNKIGGLVFDPDIRLMLTGKPKISFRDILDHRLIFLANIPKGVIGEGNSALLGALIVAQIQKAALSRADTYRRQPFYLYLDEFQNYTTDNIQDILSESRKYALSLTLANQYLDQLSGSLRSAVLNTSGTIVSFRVGYQDAAHLVKEIFPSPDYLPSVKHEIKIAHFGNLPFINIEETKEDQGWDGLAKHLTQIPARCFWWRSRMQRAPVYQSAFKVPDPILTADFKNRVQQLYDAFGTRYGRLKQDARRELNQKPASSAQPGRQNVSGKDGDPDRSPFWGL